MNWFKKAQKAWDIGIDGLRDTLPISSSNNSVYIFRVTSQEELTNIFQEGNSSGSFWASYLASPVYHGNYILVSVTNGGDIRWRGLPPREFLSHLPNGEKNPLFIRPPTIKDIPFQQLVNKNANEIIAVLDSNGREINLNELV